MTDQYLTDLNLIDPADISGEDLLYIVDDPSGLPESLGVTVSGLEDYLVSNFGNEINSLTAKTTPVDADNLVIGDSATSHTTKKLTWNNLKATLKTYLDTLYKPIAQGNYTLQMSHAAINPSNSTTYYFAGRFSVIASTAITNMRMYIPKTGVIKAAFVRCSGVNATGTQQSTFSIRVNDTTDYTISSTVQHNSLPVFFNNTSLNISVNAGDYITMKWVTPAWTSAPTSVDSDVLVYVE